MPEPVSPGGRLSFSERVADALVASDLEFVVTGAGGWLGQATLEMLDSALGEAMGSRVWAFGSEHRAVVLRSGRAVEVLPLDVLGATATGPHLLVHYAFATRERVTEFGLEEYVNRNRRITSMVADRVARQPPAGLMVTSSGAVYLGSDLATNPYGVLKAEDEQLFIESGVAGHVLIPRLFNLAGPFLNKPDRYVLGSILTDIAKGGPVRLSAARPVIRSYIHVADLVDLGFAAMLEEAAVPDGPFDTAGEQEIEVGELADLAISLLSPSHLAVERPALDGSPPDRYVGDPTVLRSLAARLGLSLRPLDRQIRDTAQFMGG